MVSYKAIGAQHEPQNLHCAWTKCRLGGLFIILLGQFNWFRDHNYEAQTWQDTGMEKGIGMEHTAIQLNIYKRIQK